jgi:hypothetical protein
MLEDTGCKFDVGGSQNRKKKQNSKKIALKVNLILKQHIKKS